tara:strand:- start:971 stop:1399 length:429 start_codon:yes stop_codon:yes gene_type:complete
MHNVIQFLIQHWLLSSLLLVLLLSYISLESQSGAGGQRVSASEAINLMNNHSATIIDTRDVDAFQKGHLINAKSIPAANLVADIKKRVKNKTQPILLVCATGKQSSGLLQQVKRAGYDRVLVLNGGIAEWSRQDYPLISGRA